MKQKALVCVQGINNKDDYFIQSIQEHKWLSSQYDIVANVQTEAYFDRQVNLPWILKKSFLSEFIGDIWNFYKSEKGRIEVCKITRQKIKSLQDQGYEVDVIAHSLGTVIAFCCGPTRLNSDLLSINNFYCLASPLGFGSHLIRRGIWLLFKGTVKHFLEFNDNFIAEKIFYLYSDNDYVSKKLDRKALVGINRASKTPPSFHFADRFRDVDHSVSEYLDFLKEIISK